MAPNDTEHTLHRFRRHAIGSIALVLLVLGVLLYLLPVEGSWANSLMAACFRLGPFLAVLWIAYPEVCRLPVWLLWTVPLLVLLLAVRPRLFLILLPVVIAFAILQPRKR